MRCILVHDPLLVVNDIKSGYGRKEVLHEVSLHVGRGEIVSILGHNGAGKSTLLSTILGLIEYQSGSMSLDGKSLTNGNPVANGRAGVTLVPQGRGIFPDLNVVENLLLGGWKVSEAAAVAERTCDVFDLFPMLKTRRRQRVGSMSGGQQQMVAAGIAIMQRPQLLMLDEPSIGLAPKVVRELLAVVADLNKRTNVAVLLVEQNIQLALEFSSRAYVLKSGRVIAEKTSAELLAVRDTWWQLY